jgi:hypothetical protein
VLAQFGEEGALGGSEVGHYQTKIDSPK